MTIVLAARAANFLTCAAVGATVGRLVPIGRVRRGQRGPGRLQFLVTVLEEMQMRSSGSPTGDPGPAQAPGVGEDSRW
jgi:hypothetical protein